MLSKSRAFDKLVEHPRILRLLDRLLLPNYLLTAYQAIQICPGEVSQPLHHDDQFMSVARPRDPFSWATIWAITDFTPDNGATLIIPGSHKWGDDHLPNKQSPLTPCVMKAGSVVFFSSTLWHGGGANTTTHDKRLALSAQYCQPLDPPPRKLSILHTSQHRQI